MKKIIAVLYFCLLLLCPGLCGEVRPQGEPFYPSPYVKRDYPYISKISFSPDGRYIVFDLQWFYTEEECRLYIVDVLKKEIYELFPHWEALDTSPNAEWSPDGSVIAIENAGKICLVNPDGTNLRELTTFYASHPVWSPDGNYLAVEKKREGEVDSGTDIMIIDRNGNEVAWVITSPDDEYPVAWSPDNSYILFVKYEERKSLTLWRANLDMSKPFPASSSGIFRLSEMEPIQDHAAISPDGSKIVTGGQMGLLIMNADGSGVIDITPNIENFEIGDVAWSPQTNKIAFVGMEPQEWDAIEGYLGPYNIYLINPDGTGLEQITFFTGVEDSQAKAPHFPLLAKVWKNAKKEIAKSKATKPLLLERKDNVGKGDKVRSKKMQALQIAERMNNLAPNSPGDKAPNKSPSLPIFAGILSLSALGYTFWKLLKRPLKEKGVNSFTRRLE